MGLYHIKTSLTLNNNLFIVTINFIDANQKTAVYMKFNS